MRLLVLVKQHPLKNSHELARIRDGHSDKAQNVCSLLRKLKKAGLVRIKYRGACVYTLTENGYIACEQYDAQDYPAH